jgi:acetyltransferase
MSTAQSENDSRQYESRHALKNGSEVFFRPVLQTDGPLLVDLFNKMSPQQIYMRFLRNLHALPEEMVRRFTRIDCQNEFALVAVIQEDGRDAIIAVGRYARDGHEDLPELAVAVRDDWQRLGLGKSLLAKVVDIAGEHGFSRFSGMMSAQNDAMRRILSELGYETRYALQSGFYQLEIAV